MIRIRTNGGKRKCIQLTWKGVEYALKVINGNNAVFEVSKESFGKRKHPPIKESLLQATVLLSF